MSVACVPADERETQKGERLRFTKAALLAPCRRMATKLDQPGLIRMQRQRILLQPRAQFFQKPPGLSFVLKAQHHIIRVADDDHVAGGVAPAPLLRPEVEDIVQVSVSQQGGNGRPLWRTCLAVCHYPFFKHSRLQPFANQPENTLVADPMFQETDEPFM